MVKAFASEQNAIGICDRCGWEYPLKDLRKERINLNISNVRVCPECWDEDHPQNRLGRRTYSDAQALRDPRVDTAVLASRYGDAVRYDFDLDLDNWISNGTATATWVSGSAILTTSGADGSIHITKPTNALSIDASAYSKVRVRINVTTETSDTDWIGRCRWRRTTDGSYASSRQIDLVRPNLGQFGEQFHVLTWDMFNESNWSGTVDSVEFIPYSTSGNVIEFSYIRFESV